MKALAMKVMPIVLAAAFTGCTMVPKNPNDSTPPNVEIKVRGSDGQYKPASTATFDAATGKLDVMCVANDPDGVAGITMNFYGHSDSCTTSGGAVYSGSFPIDGLPSSQSTSLSGDSSGKVPTQVPLMATVNGPLSCTILGSPSQKGTPYGAKFQVQCTGKNWSSNNQAATATKQLDVTLK